MLVLETGMIGTFVALDFFLFYVFWEIMKDQDGIRHR